MFAILRWTIVRASNRSNSVWTGLFWKVKDSRSFALRREGGKDVEMNVCNEAMRSCALFGLALIWSSVVLAKPSKPSATPAGPAPRWRIVKAQTYTFWEKLDERMMRGVRIWVSSPGYQPSIGAAIPDDTDLPAHWQLTDEQGRSYVKRHYGLQVLDYEKRHRQKIHVLEFTAFYEPIPYAKVGHIRLRFPLELYKDRDSKEEATRIVQVDTPITHHK